MIKIQNNNLVLCVSNANGIGNQLVRSSRMDRKMKAKITIEYEYEIDIKNYGDCTSYEDAMRLDEQNFEESGYTPEDMGLQYISSSWKLEE